MPTEFVLDASAAAKLFRQEPFSDELRTWVKRVRAEGTVFVVPPAFSFEIRNIAARSVREGSLASVEAAVEVWRETMAAVRVQDDNGAGDIRAAVLSRLSSYDASYVVLANDGRTLVTYDGPQARAALRAISPGRPEPIPT